MNLLCPLRERKNMNQICFGNFRGNRRGIPEQESDKQGPSKLRPEPDGFNRLARHVDIQSGVDISSEEAKPDGLHSMSRLHRKKTRVVIAADGLRLVLSPGDQKVREHPRLLICRPPNNGADCFATSLRGEIVCSYPIHFCVRTTLTQ